MTPKPLVFPILSSIGAAEPLPLHPNIHKCVAKLAIYVFVQSAFPSPEGKSMSVYVCQPQTCTYSFLSGSTPL